MTTCTYATCGAPTGGGTYLCERHAPALAVALPTIRSYCSEMDTARQRQARFGGATRASSFQHPTPVDMRFLTTADPRDGEDQTPETLPPGAALQRDTWTLLVEIAQQVVRSRRPAQGPACSTCLHLSCATVRATALPGRPVTVDSLTRFLERDRNLHWLVRQPFAGDTLRALVAIENRLRRFVDRPPERWYAGVCSADLPDDGGRCPAELYAQADRGMIRCDACGTRWDVGERRAFLLEEAKGYAVTRLEAAGALLAWSDAVDTTREKLADRIRKWDERGRLHSTGTVKVSGRDQRLYRIGDIQALLAEVSRPKAKRGKMPA